MGATASRLRGKHNLRVSFSRAQSQANTAAEPPGMRQTDTLVLQDNSGSFCAKRKKERWETGLGTVTGSGKGS